MAAHRRIGLLQWAIILLTTATALIHIGLAFQFGARVDLVFVLNGIGYLALVGLLYLPISALDGIRPGVRWALIAYTAITVLAWMLIGVRSTVAYVDKAIEIALIVCLWFDWQQSRRKLPQQS